MGEGKEGERGEGRKSISIQENGDKGHSIYSSKHIKCQLMLLNLGCCSFYLGPAMQHPEDKKKK